MNRISFRLLALALGLVLVVRLLAQDQTINGNLTVNGWIGAVGAIDSDANVLTFGAQSGGVGSSFFYADDAMPGGANDTFKYSLNRISASWLWQHGTSTLVPAMRLDAAHQLILYQSNGTTAGVTLIPASNQLALGTATLTATGTALSTNGALTVAGNLTNTNGSFTGGSSGLTLNSGGTNQNITLNPGGGRAIVNGLLQVSNGTDYGWIFAGSSGGLNAFHLGSFTNVPLAFFSNASAPRMVVSTSGYVGIGTTSPGVKLDVVGGAIRSNSGVIATASAAAGLFMGYGGGLDGSTFQQFALFADTTNGFLVDVPKDALGGKLDIQFNWRGGGIPGLFIKGSTGNVGLGTATPGTRRLNVQTSDSTNDVGVEIGISRTTGTNYGLIASATGSGADFNQGILTTASSGATNYGLRIYNVSAAANNYALFSDSAAQSYFQGNVGIGTTNPLQKLDVEGSIRAGGRVRVEFDRVLGGNVGDTVAIGSFSSDGIGKNLRIYLKGHNSSVIDVQSYDYNEVAYVGGVTNWLELPLAQASVSYSGAPAYAVDAYRQNIGSTSDPVWLRLRTKRAIGAGPVQLVVEYDDDSVFTPLSSPGAIASAFNSSSGPANGAVDGYYGAVEWAFPVSTAQGWGNANSQGLFVRNGGNVGIGTTNPTHKLAVNGTIRAKEVIVDTGWADYVFDESYRLATLSEVEAHIKAKKHLPGIPSAAEVAEHGVSMGDMQAKLLSKIEELTLHLIRIEKDNAAQQAEIATLRHELAALKSP